MQTAYSWAVLLSAFILGGVCMCDFQQFAQIHCIHFHFSFNEYWENIFETDFHIAFVSSE